MFFVKEALQSYRSTNQKLLASERGAGPASKNPCVALLAATVPVKILDVKEKNTVVGKVVMSGVKWSYLPKEV